MSNKFKKQSEGFTIIEVLIVLAIAGLILLIVFLAVPALQRNNRNNQRRADVGKILAAMSDFSNNNNGTLPNAIAWTNTAGTLTINGPAPTVPNQMQVGYYNVGMGASTGSIEKLAAATASPLTQFSTSLSQDWVRISTGTICSGAASAGGSARSLTAVFQIETGNSTFAQSCVAS